jgi:hypothetical protein
LDHFIRENLAMEPVADAGAAGASIADRGTCDTVGVR